MNSLVFPLSIGCSVFLHAGVFVFGPGSSDSGIQLQQGDSVVNLNINQPLTPSESIENQEVRTEEENSEKRLSDPSGWLKQGIFITGNTDKRRTEEQKILNTEAGDLLEKGVSRLESQTGLTRPRYPRFSRLHGEEGTVEVSFAVDSYGKARRVRVSDSSGSRHLDHAAARAVEEADFKMMRSWKKMKGTTEKLVFHFRLEDE